MYNTQLQPVIILGAGRSGTKFLRDLLLESAETCGIPYDVNYIWRTGNEDYPDDEIPSEHLTEDKIKVIRATFLKFSGSGESDTCRFLIEKTVGNTLRVPYIKKVFPEAKFIHLVRDGRAVTESAMRLWEAPPESGYLFKKLRYFPLKNYRYAVSYLFNIFKGVILSDRGQKTWGPIYKDLDQDLKTKDLFEICARQWYACVSKATHDLDCLSSESVLTVRYEDLMLDESTVEKITDFIGMRDNQIIVDTLQNRKQVSNLDKWKSKFSEENLQYFKKEMSDMLELYRYE